MHQPTEQHYIITLNAAEYGPFLYFLFHSSLPAELDGKWKYGKESVQLSMLLPLNFDARLVPQMWEEWREECLVAEYASLN